jgi:tRNA(fMet)-specific endonuclease VapC
LKYLLDSNVLILLLRKRAPSSPALGVARRIQTLPVGETVICSVVRAELLYGAIRSPAAPERLSEVHEFLAGFSSLPFDDPAADHAARIRADLAAKGTPIGPLDLLIAAVARSRNLTLVTHNSSEFARVPGLAIEDWEAKT